MILIPWLVLCLIPLACAIAAKLLFKRDIVLLEVFYIFIIGAVVTFIGLQLSVFSQVRDVQILNGSVISKHSQLVSCEHSYTCNCRSNSKGDMECDTCYEHFMDKDWIVQSDVGKVEIRRVDRQGLREPPRYTSTVIGEPFAYEDGYTNYVLGASNSLFSMRGEKSKAPTPHYGQVFDYYRFNHAIAAGANIPNLDLWNKELAILLQKLGPQKQANVNLIFTNADMSFADSLETSWVGGKKNDVNIVVGVKQWPKVEWAQAFTFARTKDNATVAVGLRQLLLSENALDDPHRTVEQIGLIVRSRYKRVPMAEFAYLMNEITPSFFAIVLTLLALIAALALSIHIFRNNNLRSYR